MSEKKLPSIKQRRIAGLNDTLAALRENLSIFEKAGLRKSEGAKNIVRQINEAVMERDEMIRADRQDRRECVEHLLLGIAAADFACEACNLLSSKLKDTYGELLPEQGDLIRLLDGLGKDLGGLVLIIDRASDDRFSSNFAAMSDEIMNELTKTSLAKAKEIVSRHDNADNGNNIRFKGRTDKKRS